MPVEVISDNRLPIVPQRALAPVAAARGQAGREHDRIDGAGTGGADSVEAEPFIFEQPIQHAPGERAVAADALQRQVHLLSRGTCGLTPVVEARVETKMIRQPRRSYLVRPSDGSGYSRPRPN